MRGRKIMKPLPFPSPTFNGPEANTFLCSAPILRVNLLPDRKWNFGPLLIYRPERDDVDNNQVDALKDVDAALELRSFLQI